MHTIYHIPGVKVGCTIDFKNRKKQYPPDTIFEILEELENITDEEAGDIEWSYADKFNYPRRTHYKFNWNSNLTSEQRIKIGKNNAAHMSSVGLSGAGGKIGGKVQGKINAENGHMTMLGKIYGPINGKAQGLINGKVERTCPHCGKSGKGPAMLKWHFERCKKYEKN